MSDLILKVQEMYAAFSRGDIAAILDSLADQVSWEFEAPPELLTCGTRHSPREVAEYFAALDTQFTGHDLELTEFLSSEDAVACFGRYRGTARATGIRIDSPFAHYFQFRDGKLVRHMQLGNSAAMVEAVRGQAVAAAR